MSKDASNSAINSNLSEGIELKPDAKDFVVDITFIREGWVFSNFHNDFRNPFNITALMFSKKGILIGGKGTIMNVLGVLDLKKSNDQAKQASMTGLFDETFFRMDFEMPQRGEKTALIEGFYKNRPLEI